MMQKTDRHFRYLARLLIPAARLYTEMITARAILRGRREDLLGYDVAEQPLAVQLGGSSPAELAAAARVCADYGYAEVNLNCGCPSDRVQAADFGACLMARPALVADCVKALQDALPSVIPVTVKTRLGIDDLYSYAYFRDFIGALYSADCRVFHVHARKAWLCGLSPRANREIPPLEYAWVYRLKQEFPQAVIVINGGIASVGAARTHLARVDGVLGRAAYADPFALTAYQALLFPPAATVPPLSRLQALAAYLPYVESALAGGTELRHLSRHLLTLFQGQPHGRHWRHYLTVHGTARGAGLEVLEQARQMMLASVVAASDARTVEHL